MKKYIIYRHLNKINGKSYIGQTCQKPSERWRKGNGYVSSTKFWNAIKKYGWDNFDHIILETNLSGEEANNREKYWIEYFNSVENGYNLSYGGNDLHEFSNEHKQHLKESIVKSLGKKVICLNNKKIYSSISEAAKETGATHIHDCCIGKILSSGKDENGNALIWRFVDNYNPNEKAIFKKQKRGKTKVFCFETKIIYDSAAEAMRMTGIDSTSIGRCCNGIRKSAGGYHWKWIQE